MNALIVCFFQALTIAPLSGRERITDRIVHPCEFILRYTNVETPSPGDVAIDLSNYQQKLKDEGVGEIRECSEYRIHVILEETKIRAGFWDDVATSLPKRCRSHFEIYKFEQGGTTYERHLFDWTKEWVKRRWERENNRF